MTDIPLGEDSLMSNATGYDYTTIQRLSISLLVPLEMQIHAGRQILS